MPEFLIKGGLRAGIRDSENGEKNTERLVTCYNAKPQRYGIVQHSPITFPGALASAISSAGITISHPFPQLFRGMEQTLLFTETKVYSVNESTWGLTELTLKTKAYPGSTTTIASGGGPWQFCDLGKAWFAFNGVTTVFYTDISGTYEVRVDTSVPMQTGCYYKGRAIFGGFNSSNYWNSTWTSNIQSWTNDFIVNPGGITISGIGSNFVSWSSIGGGDVLGMLYPETLVEGREEYTTGAHSSAVPLWKEYLTRNECGFMPMPWRGTVWCVKPLGNHIMVYGDNGIAALTPVTDPFPTMGMVQVSRFGLAARTAVGGNDNEHMFIDSTGAAWRVMPNLDIEKLDYANVLDQLVGDHITITHDEQQSEFHLTGSDGSGNRIVLTETESGFYTHKHPPTSGFLLNGSMVGVYESLSDSSATITTDTLDFDTRSIKTIHSIQVSSTVVDNLYVKVYFRSDSGSTWSYTDRVQLNSKGYLDLLVSGVEFRVELYTDDYTNIEKIDYIKVFWREEGVRNFKRNFR